MSQQQTYQLPPSLATQTDLRRLINEVERLDNAATTADIRAKAGYQSNDGLILSDQLQDFVATNQLDLNDARSRTELIAKLRQLKDETPVVHVTFAATASQDELSKLVDWVRQSVHPQAVLTIGLQPELIGGAYIRTTNRVFDLSVRAQLAEGRHIIARELEMLEGVVHGTT